MGYRKGLSFDQRGDHGFACEIAARGPGRQRQLAAAADRGESATLDNESGVFDRGAAFAIDEARALEQRGLAPGRRDCADQEQA
jgi:hypothetical protein